MEKSDNPKEIHNEPGTISRKEFLRLGGLVLTGLVVPQIKSEPEFSFQKDEISPSNVEFLASHEVSKGDTSRRVVLMTYDDFNSHKNIATILDAYKDHNLKTTFFFPGGYDRRYITLPGYAKEIERIVDEGHVFGCHGFLHDQYEPYSKIDPGQIRKDIEQWLGIVESIIPGYKIKWMRFPFGARNQQAKDVFAEYGMQSVMWSVESGGEDAGTYDRVTSHAGPGEIILDHTIRYFDAYDASRILDYLVANNLSVESVATGLNPNDYLPTPVKRIVNPNRHQKSRR